MAGNVDERSARLAASSLDALETRDRILAEAMRLFKVYGYSKTTVADIADACRMSPANVYRFFTSKSAINNAICERFIADDEAALVAISHLPLAATERLKRLVIELNRRSMENFFDNKKVHEMVIVALEERWEAIQDHIHRVCDIVAGVIDDGIAKGEFRRQDSKRAAQCVCAAMAPLRHPVMLAQCMDDPDKATPAEMADFIVNALK
jgi:AcrR family transcriptional regulator